MESDLLHNFSSKNSRRLTINTRRLTNEHPQATFLKGHPNTVSIHSVLLHLHKGDTLKPSVWNFLLGSSPLALTHRTTKTFLLRSSVVDFLCI